MADKKYVVVGCGWFGLRAVQTLEKLCPSADVTVLELNGKDYVDMNIATPRLLVEPDFADTVYQHLTKAWKSEHKLIGVSEVKAVAPGKVVYVDTAGAEQTLDGLDGIVLATGTVQSSPLIKDVTGKTKSDRVAQLIAFRDAVKNSKAGVVVVGGGTTGVEVAAEIGTDFPDTKCTLINKAEFLLRGSAKQVKMHQIVEKQLVALGVKVINNDHVEGLRQDYVGEAKTYTTAKGETVEADVVIVCAGGHPNTPYAPDETKDAKTGGLLINDAMLCEKVSSDPTKPVWALGDCSNCGGRGAFADPQLAAFAASVKHYDAKGTVKDGPSKYTHKVSEDKPSLVSVGRRGGAMSMPFPNKMMGKALKAKDLGLKFMYGKEFGLKV